MSIIALGLNHTTAPLDLRGRFAFPADKLVPALQAFRSRLRVAPEVAIVSTCNRTELYVGAEGGVTPELGDHALGWLAQSGGLDTPALRPHAYVLEGASAARHTFRLASGLSSMVVGETQILGQLKQAVREAGTAGTLGTTLHQLFQRSFAVAKEVRSGTAIGMHTVSMAAAIVRLGDELFGDFSELKVLFIGAGEMASPVLTHVAAQAPALLTIANRTLGRADALAENFGGESVGLVEAVARLAEFDIVVSCTASPLPLVGLGAVESAIKARRRRPMLMVDLAVPRDIEPEVARIEDVYLYTVDDLARIVQSGADKRSAAVEQAETIIESGVHDFLRWLETRRSVPLIQALQGAAEGWRATELQRARKSLAKGEDVDVVLESLSRGLTQRMLHGPMAGLQAAEEAERPALAHALARLYLQCPMRGRR